MKLCPRCSLKKTADMFSKCVGRKDGLQIYCKQCCSHESSRRYRDWPGRKEAVSRDREASQKRCREYVDRYLLLHSCVDCGEDDPIVLDFDHVKGIKYKGISVLIRNGTSLEKLTLEISKCEVRCSNCHRRVTYFRRMAG